ncbi:MAG: DUF1552 domain-containing protein [Myxococcota bacterium]|nr:DUF1552 domain-containing protein [Myxococcota bacterium]
MSNMKMDRRRFLAAMGLGGAALALPGSLGSPSRGMAQLLGTHPPKRVIFWVSPHGTVWNQWNMSPPGLAPSGTSASSIASLPDASFSRILAPLAPHKAKTTIVEGLARTAAIDYELARHTSGGFDLNRHHFGQAHLMTCVDPMQRDGATCIGGGISIDQVIGRETTAAGRWASRVYGDQHMHPYSFVAPGEASGRVGDARTAFDDVLGLHRPAPTAPSTPSTPGAPVDDRADRLRRGRGSVLDFVASEHASMAGRLGSADRAKLERHRDLIRELELSFGDAPAPAPAAPGTDTEAPAMCAPSWSELGHRMDQFARVMTLAASCDLTRVMTFVTPDLAPGEIGLPPSTDIHQDYAHTSIMGSSATFSSEGERGMIEYNLFYARRFAYFLEQLDSVPEGDGSVLDNSAVVWISELGTGAHDLHDLPVVIAGSARGALRTGQYVRYARDSRIRAGWGHLANVGPSQNQLYVTLMQAMGMENDRFGIESVARADASTLSLRGPLAELMRT